MPQMKSWVLTLMLAQLSTVALGAEYGHYDLAKVISISRASTRDPRATVNMPYLGRILDDLNSHVGIWPPQFDSAEDRRRAEHDVTALSNMLDTFVEDHSVEPPLILRLALLHGFGHNLDIPGSGGMAEELFIALLKLTPDDPQANYSFGVFYAQTAAKRASGIPYLEKARSLGVRNADYWLGVIHLSLGERAKATAELTSYTSRVPADQNAAKMLEAARNGTFGVKQNPLIGTPANP